ncbi:MAG: hypothetical protein Q9187_008196 [Circinaria calcarea]
MAEGSDQQHPKAPTPKTPSSKSTQHASYTANEQHPPAPDDDGRRQQVWGYQDHKGGSAAMRAWLAETPQEEPWYAGSRLAGRDHTQNKGA